MNRWISGTLVSSLALGLFATGCGSSSQLAASTPAYPSSTAPAYAEGASAASAPPSAPATSPLSSSEAAPPAEARAGLGTEWGESRVAPITIVSFERAAPDNPFALATVRYNDRDGFRGLVGSGGHRSSNLTVGGGAVTVSVRDDDGDALDAVNKNGQLFVVGRAGERYSLVLENHTPRRYEAVATVDGLDVMDGTAGSFGHRGYILLPHATVVIEGFRKSDDQVAAFRFGTVADSYAGQTGSARDVGVIGVAFFREVGDTTSSETEGALRRTANPFPDQNRWAHPPAGRE